VGWESDTKTHGIYARVLGESTTYSATDTTGTNFYTSYDELYIGTDHDGLAGANAIFQDVNVWAGTISPCCAIEDYVEFMADEDNIKEHMVTAGRQYYLHPTFVPSPYMVDKFDATIEAIQLKGV